MVLLALMAWPSVALAQGCVPYTINDAGELNQVIVEYNTECGPGEEIIATIDGTITLQTDSTQIDNSTGAGLILQSGEGPGILDGDGAHRILDIDNGNVVIEGLTLQNGQVTDLGGAGIHNRATLTVRDSTFANNNESRFAPGGAIYNNGTLTVERSTFEANSANTGGAIYNDGEGSAEIVNSTFYDNFIDNGNGSAVANAGVMTIVGSTLAYNGSGVETGALHHAASPDADTTIRNSIVARNSPLDCSGAAAEGFNPIDANMDADATCAGFTHPEATPLLDEPLADNGGPTETLALLPDSEAIDVASNCPPPNTDQRGVERPQGEACDLGAFEVESTGDPEPDPDTFPDLTATKTNTAGGSGNVGSTFQWQITVTNQGTAEATFEGEAFEARLVFADVLPIGADYGSVTFDDSDLASGSAMCELQSQDEILGLVCYGAPSVTLAPGDRISVSVDVTPTELGELQNPREFEGTICGADPSNVITESIETNNECEDVVTVESQDSDGDGITDDDEGDGDRDDDGLPNPEDFDPAGYFYCRDTGEIVEGGSIGVSGPAPANVHNDGSGGRYDFTVNTPGTYTIVFDPPPAAIVDSSFERATSFDPTGMSNPVVLGPGEDGDSGFLSDDPVPYPTDFYTTLELAPGDPHVINNNVPLVGGPCAEGNVGGDLPMWGDHLVFPTPETFIGADLNSDGDDNDAVLRIKNVRTGTITNTGIPVSQHHRAIDLHEQTAVFVMQESGLSDPMGLFNLWGGTRADEGPIGVLNVETGEVTMLDVWGTRPTVHENIVTISGSTLRYYDLSEDRLVNTGYAGTRPAVWGDWIVYERTMNDVPRLQLYHLPTGGTRNTGIAGAHPAIHKGTVAFTTEESLVGEDLNDDGDQVDTIVRAYDIARDRVVNTRQAGQTPAIFDERIAFSQGRSVLYHDLSTGRTYDTGQQGAEPDIFRDTITSYVWEGWLGTDRSADGDLEDPIVQTHLIDDPDRVLPKSALATNPQPQPLKLQGTARHQRANGVRLVVQGQGIDEVNVRVFDLSGRRVADKRTNGSALTWHFRNADGHRVANGVYLYVVTARSSDGRIARSDVRKLVVMR